MGVGAMPAWAGSEIRMSKSDENNTGPEGAAAQETPDVAALTAQVADLTRQLDDWKGYARKHEDQAKANKADAERAEAKLADAGKATTAAVREALVKAHNLDDKGARLLTADTIEGLYEQLESITALRAPTSPPPASAPLEGTRPATDGGNELSGFARQLFNDDADA